MNVYLAEAAEVSRLGVARLDPNTGLQLGLGWQVVSALTAVTLPTAAWWPLAAAVALPTASLWPLAAAGALKSVSWRPLAAAGALPTLRDSEHIALC